MLHAAIQELFKELIEAHETALSNIAGEGEFTDIELIEQDLDEKEPLATYTRQHRYCRKSIVEVSRQLLEYRINEDEWLIPDANFRGLWRKICVDTAASGATEYAIYLCKVVIEIAFLETMHDPYENPASRPVRTGTNSNTLIWAEHLAKIGENTDEPILEQAFEELLEYDYEESDPPIMPLHVGAAEKHSYYHSALSREAFGTLNCYPEYPDLLEELKRQSVSS